VRVLPFVQNHFPRLLIWNVKNQMFFGSRHGYIKKTTFFFFFGCGHRQAVGEEPISNVIQNDSLELQSFYTVNREIATPSTPPLFSRVPKADRCKKSSMSALSSAMEINCFTFSVRSMYSSSDLLMLLKWSNRFSCSITR